MTLNLYIWKGVPYVTDSYHHDGGVAAVATSQNEAAILADMACGDPASDYTERQLERFRANGLGMPLGKSGVEKRAERLEALLHRADHPESDDEDPCGVCDAAYDLELRVVEIDPSLRGAWTFADRGCC